jgi:membrane fusion protein (multidrug efflux system)
MLQRLNPDRPATTKSPVVKRMIIMLLAVGLVFGGIFGFQWFGKRMMMQYMSSMGLPVQTVATIKAEVSEWQSELRAVGSVRAEKGSDLSAEVGGIVEEIRFDSGDQVEEGQVLVTLRAQVDNARLREAQAALELARTNHRRNQDLVKAGTISQAALDTTGAALRSAEARVNQESAAVQRTEIRAPFSGRIGIRMVDVGQYLTPGTSIATLQDLNSLFVDFYLPQRNIGSVAAGQSLNVYTDSHPDLVFTAEVLAVDSKVDFGTRNVGVRARVILQVGQPQKYVTLPASAVIYNPYGDMVYVVAPPAAGSPPPPQGMPVPEGVAQQAFIDVGPSRGDQVAILKGLKEGDTVVTAGQIKLQNGTPVKINNSIQPPNDPNPQVPDEPTAKK